MLEGALHAMVLKDEVELLEELDLVLAVAAARFSTWRPILVAVVEQFYHRFDCSLSAILDH